jgi:hypothetical protein
MGAKDSVLVGSSGEHYIIYRLQRRNLLAALAPANAFAADILVFSPAMSVGSLVQVKTRTTGADGGWSMNVKHETLAHPRLFYAFLDLEPSEPRVFIVPCAVVQDMLRSSHAAWLAGEGRAGHVRRDNPMRRVRPLHPFAVPGFPDGWMEAYSERWDLLMADPADSAPATSSDLPDGPGR